MSGVSSLFLRIIKRLSPHMTKEQAEVLKSVKFPCC